MSELTTPESRPTVQLPPRAPDDDLVERDLVGWRRQLLPVMVGMLLALTLSFVALSVWQVGVLEDRIAEQPELDVAAFRTLDAHLQAQGAATDGALLLARLHASLEANVVARRYHQANVLVLSRAWTRFMGFLTGMILALVGGAFILGRLQLAMSSSAEGEMSGAKVSIQSTSPGLVMTVLGTVLMSVSVAVRADVTVQDGNTYLSSSVSEVRQPPARPLDPGAITHQLQRELSAPEGGRSRVPLP